MPSKRPQLSLSTKKQAKEETEPEKTHWEDGLEEVPLKPERKMSVKHDREIKKEEKNKKEENKKDDPIIQEKSDKEKEASIQRLDISANVCLAMMIKNEEKSLRKSLASCIPIIHSVRIYDTGSTDSTLDVLACFQKDYPDIDVKWIQGEFVDFSTSRNILLDFVDTDPSIDFVLLLDANDELNGHEDLVKLIEKEKSHTECSGYLLRQQWKSQFGIDSYYNYRLVKARHQWRYKAPVHEYLCSIPEHEKVTMRVENTGIYIYQDRTQNCENSFVRFSRDRDILLREHVLHPDDTRTIFYLAQSCKGLGLRYEAYYYYKLRSTLKGYYEEVYESLRALGTLAKDMNMDSSVYVGWWLKAFEHTPRIECLVNIADHYLFTNVKHYMAAMFTTKAVQLEYPMHCFLFVNKLDYDYTRYYLDGIAQFYVGNYQQGLESCKKAIAYAENVIKTTTNQNDIEVWNRKLETNQKNLVFYVQKLEKQK